MYSRINTRINTISSQGGFILVDLAIEHENRVVAHGRTFNTGDDQIIHTGPIRSDNIRVNIMDPSDMDDLLPISRDEMTIVRDAIGSFVPWLKKLITLNTRVCLS